MFLLVAAWACAVLLGVGVAATHNKAPAGEAYCYPFNYTCGPITPSPPNRYEAHLEYVDLIFNITHYIEEIYDYERQLLALTDSWDGIYTHTIFYYASNTAVFMAAETGVEEGMSSVECSVVEISQDATFYNPFPGDNGTHLALAPSQALLFGDDYRYSWKDNETERSLGCNRWDACISVSGGTFYVRYLWSDPSQVVDMLGYPSERPVKMRMTGELMPPQGTTVPVTIDSLYSMALFDDNPQPENVRWAFEIPSGMYCAGLPAGKPPPTKLADYYSMRVEVTYEATNIPHQEVVFTVKNWYDTINLLTRTDTIPNPYSVEYEVAGPVEVAIVRDFRGGAEYVVDKSLGNCTTLVLTNGSYDTITTPDGKLTIKDPLALFGLGGVANLTYHGTKHARGLPCDVWVGHQDFESENGTVQNAYLYEVYFLQDGWTDDAGASTKHLPVPVLIKLYQDIILSEFPEYEIITNLHQNIFKFEEEEPLMSTYDITSCFSGHDHIRRFQIAFPGSFRDDYDKKPAQFTQQVHGGLSNDLYIPPIRLQHLLIEYNEDDNLLYCEFTLVDQPQVDMEMPPYIGLPLDHVVEQLKKDMDNLIIILFDESYIPSHIKKMVALNDSLREMFEDSCNSLRDVPEPLLMAPNDPDPPPQSYGLSTHDKGGRAQDEGSVFNAELTQSAALGKKQQLTRSSTDKIYTPGDMAGMGVGMLLLGVLLGSIIMVVALKKMGLTSDLEYIAMSSRRQ